MAGTKKAAGKGKDPLFAAAVLKLSFRLANNEHAPAFKFVYDGVLRDCSLEDSQVETYLDRNYEKVLKAARGKPRGAG